MVVTDERVDRMRVIVPIEKPENLNASQMERLLQVNFDSALDARYAIAKDVLWNANIHPLSLISTGVIPRGLPRENKNVSMGI